MECLFADIDFPEQNEHPFTTHGNSPKILKEFIDWLEGLDPIPEQLYIALFLFNNEVLYQALDRLARRGCHVTVFTIPLEGYDNRYTKAIYDPDTGQQTTPLTKYDIAKQLFEKAKGKEGHQFELRIVSKMFVRSASFNNFSRGNWPYALHCKTFYLTQNTPEGTNHYVGITSSNLAVRDETKIEVYSLFKLENPSEIQNCSTFFGGLLANSTPAGKFKDPDAPLGSANYYNYFNGLLQQKTVFMEPQAESSLLYSAPFFENSPHTIEDALKREARSAKSRIYICAEHISAFLKPVIKDGKRNGEYRPGILFGLLERIRTEESPPPASFISQTSAIMPACRSPQNRDTFEAFEKAAYKLIKAGKKIRFIAEDLFHAKICIFDDNVIITTANMTPTQFDYIKNCKFTPKYNTNYKISGVFCEYGVFGFIISNKELADKLAKKLDGIIDAASDDHNLAYWAGEE